MFLLHHIKMQVGGKAYLIFFMLHQNVQGLAHKLLIC